MSDGDYEDDGMTLNVDDGDDNMGLSLDLTGDDDNEDVNDEELRAQAGFNSPKKTGDSDDDVDAITPRTAARMRQEAGINSPKQDKKMGFGDDEDGKEEGSGVPNALAGLVTQVQRPDPVPQDEELDEGPTTTQTTGQTSSKPAPQTTAAQPAAAGGGGMCACLTALFTCCSSDSTATNNAQALSTQQVNSSAGSEKSDAPLVQSATPTPATGAGASSTKNTSEVQGEQGEVVPGVVTADEDGEDDYAFESEESSTEYPDSLLPPPLPEHEGKKCMVLDLDETLVHSSFRPVKGADFIIPVEIDGVVHRVYVMKRPYVDEYLVELAKDYEIVIFTASLSKYADPLLDTLDTQHTITHRLFRESCVLHSSAYVKDLRRLGRKLRDIIIVDNSPASYLFQPKNAVPVASWFDDKHDTQLRDWLPFAATTLKNIYDVRWILDANHKTYKWLCQQAGKDLDIFTPPTAKRKK